MSWRGDVKLHVRTCRHCFTQFDVGTPPEVIDDGEVWLPPESRQRFADAVEQNLAEQGVLSAGDLRSDFRDALTVLAKPEAGFFAWVQSHDEGSYASQIVRVGRNCVSLFRRGNWVRIQSAAPEGMARELINLLPEFPLSDAKSLTVRESEAPWLDGDDDAPVTRESRALRDTLYLPRYGGAQLGAVTTRGDTRIRAAAPLHVLDTEGGRWLYYRTDGGGERYIVGLPGADAKIATKLEDLLDQIR